MSAAAQAEAFFPSDCVLYVILVGARAVDGFCMLCQEGFDQSRISEAAHRLMIFLDLLSAFIPVPFNGQLSF